MQISVNKAYAKIQKHRQRGLIRQRYAVQQHDKPYIKIDGRRYIDFSSNDYLGLNQHPLIKKGLINAANQFGVGSGASAIVSGFTAIHQQVEQAFSEWLNVDQCLLFNSGYTANLGVISALCNHTSLIYSDRLCHASMIDGIILSRAKHQRFQHGDMQHLQQLIKKHHPDLIISDTLFSMHGDLAPIAMLQRLANESEAILLLDDAHAIGILGCKGRGAVEYAGQSLTSNTCLSLPLGKAFNVGGCIVGGSHRLIESIFQFSRSYHYTTAISPALCGAILAALHVIKTEVWRREVLQQNIVYFVDYAQQVGLLSSMNTMSPIQPVMIRSIDKLTYIHQYLKNNGVYVPAIRSPTVPPNQGRLRISLSAAHTKSSLKQLVQLIQKGLECVDG